MSEANSIAMAALVRINVKNDEREVVVQVRIGAEWVNLKPEQVGAVVTELKRCGKTAEAMRDSPLAERSEQ